MKLDGAKINFLGDSITEGARVADPKNIFPALIADECSAICRNYGIGGTRIARQSEFVSPQDPHDFCGRIGRMDSDADIVVIFGGTNDYGHGDAPLGTMDDRTPYTFYGALHTLYTGVINRFPNAKIVVITPLHRINEDKPCVERKALIGAEPLKVFVDIIREVAEYYSLPVLDLYKNSGLQPNVPILNEKYFADGLHPNDEGHKVLAREIIKFLKAL